MTNLPPTANAADSDNQARLFSEIKQSTNPAQAMVLSTPGGQAFFFRCSRCGMRGGRSRDRAQAEAAMADHNALRCLS